MTASIGGLGGRVFAGIAAHPIRSSLIAAGAVGAGGLLVGCGLFKSNVVTNAAGQKMHEPTPRERSMRSQGFRNAEERMYQEQSGVGRYYAGPEHARTTVKTASAAIMFKWDTAGHDGPDGVIDLRTESFTPHGQTGLPFLQHVDKDFGNGDAKVGYEELQRLFDAVDTDVDHMYGGGTPRDGILNEREMTRLYTDHHWFTDRLTRTDLPEGLAVGTRGDLEGKLVLEAYGDASAR